MTEFFTGGKFMKKYYKYCEFCGTKISKYKERCPSCSLEFIGPPADVNPEINIPNPERLGVVVAENISVTDGIFNYKRFNDELEMNKFDIEKWNPRSYFKTGVRYKLFLQIGIYIAVLAFIFLSYSIDIRGNGGMILLILAVLGSIIMIPINKVTFKKSLSFNGTYIYYERPSRYSAERYRIEYKDLDKLEIIFDDNLSPTNIVFTAKENTDIMARVFNLPVNEFYRKNEMIQYILLLSIRNNFNLHIIKNGSKANIDSIRKDEKIQDKKEILKETLYVRTDFKASEFDISEDEFQKHLKYLENVSSERYLMGGGFKNFPSGMIVFSAKDFEEADSIAKNDPIILSGAYKYELKEWEIVLKN